MSFLLPTIAREIGQRACFKTGKGNFFTIDVTTKEGQRIEYEVYFKVSKEGRGRLRLFIESAYIRDKGYGSSQPQKKKINFFIIARNVQMGKAIK